ncbi:elongation factor Ts, partial [Francisella tularensis subsp. holarctica]|nr:elongation factor Ts [Francisella tularensis subsp. holarctica]
MSNISAKLVKELRERTAAGMMECKKALVAAAGDIEKAAEEMRNSGQAKDDKKASRDAPEGVIEV